MLIKTAIEFECADINVRPPGVVITVLRCWTQRSPQEQLHDIGIHRNHVIVLTKSCSWWF